MIRSANPFAQEPRYELITRVLRSNIQRGILPEGLVLLEGPIATAMQTSRVPVQAALRQLLTEGLIHRFDGRGYLVGPSGKTTAPATCNALECVLVHQAVAERFIPALLSALAAGGVQTRACPQTLRLALAARLDTSPAHLVLASPDDFGREFLDLTIAVKLVASLDEAVAHIDRYGSSHTESIITQSRLAADEFLTRVQASCTFHNASTRMNDGHALGLGAEIGISTTRLHAYGVMGLQELTAQRYVAIGTGQSR